MTYANAANHPGSFIKMSTIYQYIESNPMTFRQDIGQ